MAQYLNHLELHCIGPFEHLALPLTSGLNVLIGRNATGKTFVMKALYAALSAEITGPTKNRKVSALSRQFAEVFGVAKLGRLVKQNADAHRGEMTYSWTDTQAEPTTFAFSSQASDLKVIAGQLLARETMNVTFIPVKEMLSTANNGSLAVFNNYRTLFDATYMDLVKKLMLPIPTAKPDPKIDHVMHDLVALIGGSVKLDPNGNFYLQNGHTLSHLEASLLAEGYKKLATVWQLLANHAISIGGILFWDEPESNLNPRSLPLLAQVLTQLADDGVQIFISTHSYFLLRELEIRQQNQQVKKQIQFNSLYRDTNAVQVEVATDVLQLTHNDVYQEFEGLYERQLGAMFSRSEPNE